MKFLILIISLYQMAYGSTSLNADKRRASYFQYAITLYEKNNRLPHSWGDLRASKESSDYVGIIEKMEVKGYANDFIKTFRFIPSEIEIKIKDASELVVAMATRNMIADENPLHSKGDLLLVVQTIDKNITIRQLSEDALIRRKYGLANRLADIPAKTVNFCLPNDSALGSWSANNLLFKPQPNAYFYRPSQIIKLGYIQPRTNAEPETIYPVTNENEAMGFITQSRSRAAGAVLSTGGKVSSSVDLRDFGFDTVHSAAWRWNIQSTNLFWTKLLKTFDLIITP